MHTEHVKLGPDGRIVLPVALRKSVGLKPGDTVVIESDGDSLLVRPADVVLRETQNYFRHYTTPGTSVVDTLIADRRAEAATDDADGPRVKRD